MVDQSLHIVVLVPFWGGHRCKHNIMVEYVLTPAAYTLMLHYILFNKMLPKKSRKNCDTSYMILLWFSFTKYDAKIKNFSLRKNNDNIL